MPARRGLVGALCLLAAMSAPPVLGEPAPPLVLRRLIVRPGLERPEVIERAAHDDAHFGRVAMKSWSSLDDDGVWTRVVELQLGRRSPRTIAGYLEHWRRSHGCTTTQVEDVPPLGRLPHLPPQLTFGGSCEGGDIYLMRVVILAGTAYELHADTSIANVRQGPMPPLRPALAALLDRLALR